MRSNVPARPAHGQDAAAAGRVGDQLVAGKGMGLPGGRGSPIQRRDRGQAACPTRALRLARLAASDAHPLDQPPRPRDAGSGFRFARHAAPHTPAQTVAITLNRVLASHRQPLHAKY
jgi:hypothetical protein